MNRIVVFMQVWNEEMWFPYSYESIYDFADEIIIAEGCHTEWNQNSNVRSTDNTLNILNDILAKDTKKKTQVLVLNEMPINCSKLKTETIVKNTMLMNTKLETGDWIFVVDADEIYKKEDLRKLKEFLKNTTSSNLKMTEYQFFYNFSTYIDANHFRLFKYLPGSRFVGVNHLRFADEKDYWNDSETIPEDICKMYHYSYVKNPKDIWTKINSFNRDSYLYPDRIRWFKDVFIPFTWKNRRMYYRRAKKITNEKSLFAWEGSKELKKFVGEHPEIMDFHPYRNINWMNEIKNMRFEDKNE